MYIHTVCQRSENLYNRNKRARKLVKLLFNIIFSVFTENYFFFFQFKQSFRVFFDMFIWTADKPQFQYIALVSNFICLSFELVHVLINPNTPTCQKINFGRSKSECHIVRKIDYKILLIFSYSFVKIKNVDLLFFFNFNCWHQLHDLEINLCVLYQNACDEFSIDLDFRHKHASINKSKPFCWHHKPTWWVAVCELSQLTRWS